jgi:hypothetical protein
LSEVLTVADVDHEVLSVLGRFDLDLIVQSTDDVIAGSFWGDAEAGIIGHSVFVRPDTPVHSLLHESSHVICMDGDRRSRLDRDAEIVLADHIVGVGRERIMADMDAWGYSFRLGSTRAWFENDADDAQKFLLNHNLIDSSGEPTFFLRP